MATLWRAVFVGTGLERDDGLTRRPTTAAEVNAEWLWLAMRGHFPVTVQGPMTPEESRHLRNFLSRPGRPHASHHRGWAERFRELHSGLCAQHAAYHVDGDTEPTNLGTAGLIAIEDYARHPERWRYDPEMNLKAAERRVWGAVKPLI
jgi:hypothetical protein